jgi:hypothetical protein
MIMITEGEGYEDIQERELKRKQKKTSGNKR